MQPPERNHAPSLVLRQCTPGFGCALGLGGLKASHSRSLPQPAPAPPLAIVSEGTLPDDAPLAVKERLRLLDVAAAAHRARRRQKVLWSVDDAIAELALCQTRDELLEVTLRFAYRRLHTASIFVRLSQGLTCFDVLDPLLEEHELKRFVNITI